MVFQKKVMTLGFGALILFGFGAAIHENLIHLPIQRSVEARLIEGLEDDRVLVGASHVVFVGKVLEKKGQVEGEAGPLTQFDVEIIQSIKGNLSGTIVLSQEGGYENGILTVVENQPLLVPGTTYVLSARTDGNGLYIVLPTERAHIALSKNKYFSSEQLSGIASSDQNVRRIKDAYAHEIPLRDDVENGIAINGYQVLKHKSFDRTDSVDSTME